MSERGIREGMPVYAADGTRLGEVVSLDADGFHVRLERAPSVAGEEVVPGEVSAPPIEREHETYDGALSASNDPDAKG